MRSWVLLSAALCLHLSQLEDDCTQRPLCKGPGLCQHQRSLVSEGKKSPKSTLFLHPARERVAGRGDVKRLLTQMSKPRTVSYQKDLPGELCCSAALPTAFKDTPGGQSGVGSLKESVLIPQLVHCIATAPNIRSGVGHLTVIKAPPWKDPQGQYLNRS